MSTETLALVIGLGIVVWACYRTASEFMPHDLDGIIEVFGIIVAVVAMMVGLIATVGLMWITFSAWVGG